MPRGFHAVAGLVIGAGLPFAAAEAPGGDEPVVTAIDIALEPDGTMKPCSANLG